MDGIRTRSGCYMIYKMRRNWFIACIAAIIGVCQPHTKGVSVKSLCMYRYVQEFKKLLFLKMKYHVKTKKYANKNGMVIMVYKHITDHIVEEVSLTPQSYRIHPLHHEDLLPCDNRWCCSNSKLHCRLWTLRDTKWCNFDIMLDTCLIYNTTW